MNYLTKILYTIDQSANVIFAPVFNAMTRDKSYKFGNPDETISSALGKNIERGTCRWCHWICKYFLHPIDNNHCIDSIEHDE